MIKSNINISDTSDTENKICFSNGNELKQNENNNLLNNLVNEKS